MVDILLLQTVSILVTSAGLLLAALYYVLQIGHQTKMRKTDLLMRLWLFGSDEVMDALDKVMGLQFKDYEDFASTHGSIVSKDPTVRALWRVFNYFGLLGILVDAKLIDIESVIHITGFSTPQMLYEKLKPIISGLRRDWNEPYLMQDFEYICIELAKKKPQTMEMWKKREQKLQESVRNG
jgi:hypothetical protein